MYTEEDKQKWISLGNIIEDGLNSEFGSWLKKKLENDYAKLIGEVIDNGNEISRGKAQYVRQLLTDIEITIKNKNKIIEEDSNG